MFSQVYHRRDNLPQCWCVCSPVRDESCSKILSRRPRDVVRMSCPQTYGFVRVPCAHGCTLVTIHWLHILYTGCIFKIPSGLQKHFLGKLRSGFGLLKCNKDILDTKMPVFWDFRRAHENACLLGLSSGKINQKSSSNTIE